jgi:hypothetical protein
MTEFRCFTNGIKLAFYNMDNIISVMLDDTTSTNNKFMVVIHFQEEHEMYQFTTRDKAVKAIYSFFGIMHD